MNLRYETGLCLLTRPSEGLPRVMNFGCGNKIMPGAVNIDIHMSIPVVEANLNEWLYTGDWCDPHEFPANHFEAIYCTDVLEHIHPDDIGNLLYCMNTCMSMGGKLYITVPNFVKMAEEIVLISRSNKKLSNIKKKHLDALRRINIIWMAPYKHQSVGHQSLWVTETAIDWCSKEGFSIYNIFPSDYSVEMIFIKESSCQL